MASVIGKLGAELLGRIGRGSPIAHRHASRRDLGVYASLTRGVKPTSVCVAGAGDAKLRAMRQLYVLFHSRGPAWDHRLDFTEQPGIEQHIAFMRRLGAQGALVLGGPFAAGDAASPIGMAVITAPDIAEAERLALEDQSVASGLISVSVRPWSVFMGDALGTIPPAGEG